MPVVKSKPRTVRRKTGDEQDASVIDTSFDFEAAVDRHRSDRTNKLNVSGVDAVMAEYIAHAGLVSSVDAAKPIAAMLNSVYAGLIKRCLLDGVPFHVPGVGHVETYTRSASRRNNPQLGKTVPIPPRRSVRIRVSRTFVDQLKELPTR